MASHHCPSASSTAARWEPQVGHEMPKNFLYVQGSSCISGIKTENTCLL